MLNDSTMTITNNDNLPNGNGHSKPREVKPADAEARLAEMEAQIQVLKKQLSMAKGTEDKIERLKLDLGARIEQVLRSKICTTEELAKIVGEPVGKVQEKIRAIRKNLADVGTPDQARWVWRIGDTTSAKELRDLVAKLIEGHKMTTAQLTKVTGARMSRVNGVLVDLQRTPGVPIYNLGSDFRAEWLIVPKTAKPANLPPKGKK